jgi:short subunit dehydrogenase-like uncharacterized protein
MPPTKHDHNSPPTGAAVVSLIYVIGGAITSVRMLHPLLKKLVPKPGEGPSEDTRIKGYWTSKVVAETDGRGASEEGKKRRVTVYMGDKRDPGYWSTSRMLLVRRGRIERKGS